MGDRNGNEVVENKIICFAYILLAEISICYIWERCLVLGGGQDLYYGKKEVSQNSHPLIVLPHFCSKVRFTLWFDYAVPKGREGMQCVKNNLWIVVQFQGHWYSCFKNDWRNSVGSEGVTGSEKEKCKIYQNGLVSDYNSKLFYYSSLSS